MASPIQNLHNDHITFLQKYKGLITGIAPYLILVDETPNFYKFLVNEVSL
jgi:hypothetical protein